MAEELGACDACETASAVGVFHPYPSFGCSGHVDFTEKLPPWRFCDACSRGYVPDAEISGVRRLESERRARTCNRCGAEGPKERHFCGLELCADCRAKLA